MSNNNTRYVTIVTNEKGERSYHTSWKSACEAYDWEYTKYMRKKVGEYKIKKAPLETTIQCLDLVEFINRKNVVQSVSRDETEGVYEIEVHGYSMTYWVKCDYEKNYKEGEAGGSGPYGAHNGDCEWISGGYYDTLMSVMSVEIQDENDDMIEMKIDRWTEDQLLDVLETTDY